MYAFLMSVMLMGAPQGGGQQGGSALGMFLPLILIFVIMYLLIFRPQAKKQKQHRQMLDQLEKGDKVVTAGGIYGQIVGMKNNDTVVVLKIDDNVKIEVQRSSIGNKITKE